MFQAKLLCSMDESNPKPTAFNELRSATDLALRATKMTAQAIGRSIPSLVVLERHLWINLTEMKNADKVPFLDSLVSPTDLLNNKMRLYISIHSKTPAIWRRGLQIGSAQQRLRPARRSDEFAGERSCGNGFPNSERVRLLQPLLPSPRRMMI